MEFFFAFPYFPRDGLSRQPRHPPALLMHLIPDWQHPPEELSERMLLVGMKVTLPWNPRPGSWSSAQLLGFLWGAKFFPLWRMHGLRGNIIISRAGMQQLNSSIPFIKSLPPHPLSPTLTPHRGCVSGCPFQVTTLRWSPETFIRITNRAAKATPVQLGGTAGKFPEG